MAFSGVCDSVNLIIMKGYIYKVMNLVNEKLYIGQTTGSVRNRWQHHKSPRSACTIFKNAIKKYGSSAFEVTVIKEITADSKKELYDLLNDLESKYIKENNSLSPNGYNYMSGGKNSPGKRTEVSPFKGKKHTEESKEKIAAANRGLKRPHMIQHMDKIHEACKKPIKCNETGQIWNSVLECAEFFKVKPKQISRVLKGERKRLKWQYTFDYL